MSERGGEKAGEKSFFARTAKITSKRAKRAQEKVRDYQNSAAKRRHSP